MRMNLLYCKRGGRGYQLSETFCCGVACLARPGVVVDSPVTGKFLLIRAANSVSMSSAITVKKICYPKRITLAPLQKM